MKYLSIFSIFHELKIRLENVEYFWKYSISSEKRPNILSWNHASVLKLLTQNSIEQKMFSKVPFSKWVFQRQYFGKCFKIEYVKISHSLNIPKVYYDDWICRKKSYATMKWFFDRTRRYVEIICVISVLYTKMMNITNNNSLFFLI